MKVFKISFIILFSLFTGSSFAQWTQLPFGDNSFYQAGNKLYACPGVYVSTDYGNTWSGLGLDSCHIKLVVQNGNKLFAGSSWYGVYISTNEGQSWTNISNVPITFWNVNTLCTYGNHIFAGYYYGIYHSTNDGANWTTANAGLNNLDVHSIIIKDNILFAGTAGGVYLSTNNGLSWTASITNIGKVNKLATNGYNIYCCTNGGGVLLSPDDGTSWSYINSGLPIYDVTALAVSGNNLLVSQFVENGWILKVYYSSNNGQNWLDATGNLQGPGTTSLCVSGGYVFASVFEGYRRPLSGITGILKNKSQVPESFRLYQNFPNPFNPTTSIKIGIPAGVSGNVNLVVYNELGKEVVRLIDGEYKPGTYKVEWDASNYPSGVYFYKLTTSGFTDIKKMVLIK